MAVQCENNIKAGSTFWLQWLKILSLLIALIISPFYLYLMTLYGVADGLMVLLMGLFISFVTYYIIYLLLGLAVVSGTAFWLISHYSKQRQRIEVVILWMIALVWGIGMLCFAFGLIPYNSSARTYF